MAMYGVDADEIWLLPGGRSHAVKHKALERIANEKKMVVESLKVLALNQLDKTAAMEAIVTMGDKRVITTGEAAPSNNKNAYVLAMAEKRALDRAYLKLLSVHGDIYSDVEADEFVDTPATRARRAACSQVHSMPATRPASSCCPCATALQWTCLSNGARHIGKRYEHSPRNTQRLSAKHMLSLPTSLELMQHDDRK
jgi:hypothetical protein